MAFRVGELGQFRTIDFLEICEIGIATNKYTFLYDKLYSIVPSDDAPADPTQQALKHFDNVPRLTGALEFVANREGKGRIFASANLENYDVDDCVDLTVNLDDEIVDPCLITIKGTVNINIFPEYTPFLMYTDIDFTDSFTYPDGKTFLRYISSAFGNFYAKRPAPSDETLPQVGFWDNGNTIDGFVVYLAGTTHYGVSKSFARVPTINRDGSFEIKDVPRGKYIMRVASYYVGTDNAYSDIYNLNNGIAWQKTSSPVMDCAGSLAATGIPHERIVDITAAVSVFDLDTEPGYGPILIECLQEAQLDGSGLNGVRDQRFIIEGYFLDNNAQQATIEDRLAAIACERQKVNISVLTLTNAYPLGFSAGIPLITDHNGYWYYTWKNVDDDPSGPIPNLSRKTIKNLYPIVPDVCNAPAFREMSTPRGTNFIFTGEVYDYGLQAIYFDLPTQISKTYVPNTFSYDPDGLIYVIPTTDFVSAQFLIMYNTDAEFTQKNKTIVQGTVVESTGLGVVKTLMCIERNGRQEETDANGGYAIAVYCPWDKFVRDDDTLFPQYLLDKCYDYPPTPLFVLLDINAFCNIYDINNVYEVPDFVYGFAGALTDEGKSLKSGGRYRTGIIYEDYYNRKSTVVEGNTLRIPFFTERTVYGKFFISWEINGIPPIWAHHYRLVRTKDSYYRRYLTIKLVDIEYVIYDSVNSMPVITSYANANFTHIHLKVTDIFDEDLDSEAAFGFSEAKTRLRSTQSLEIEFDSSLMKWTNC